MSANILLLEDNAVLAYGLVYSLEKAGYKAFHAETIASAEVMLRENDIELILLDVMLPDGNGYDFCARLRETDSVPIIFLTACDDDVNVVSGFELGADDYITKPFRVQELLLRIRAVLRRCGTARDYSGLTKIEARLLEILRENSGRTISRNHILEQLWDSKGEFVDNNTLSVHIRRLRSKIGAEHITTIRGMGYKWTD